MPAIITEDILDGASVHTDKDGTTLPRIFTMRSIVATTASGVLLQAERELASQKNIIVGSVHPDRGDMFVSAIDTMRFGKSTDQAKITVTYKTDDGTQSQTPNNPVVRFTGTVRGVTTNFDRDKKPIKVSPPNGIDAKGMIAKVNDDKAFGILTADWISPTSARWLIKYVNKINAADWFGEPKWAWFVRDVTIEKAIGIAGWKVHLEIELDEELYVTTSAWRDPITNQIPDSVPQTIDRTKIGPQAGYTNSLQKFESDFNRLPIPQSAL